MMYYRITVCPAFDLRKSISNARLGVVVEEGRLANILFEQIQLSNVAKTFPVETISQNGNLLNNINEPTKSIWASIWFHLKDIAPISANWSDV